jgi:carboxypeptidase Taq
MTTRFKEDDLTEGLTGAIHETGHALYEQGRNLEYDGLPVNQVPLSGSLPCLDPTWEGSTATHNADGKVARCMGPQL